MCVCGGGGGGGSDRVVLVYTQNCKLQTQICFQAELSGLKWGPFQKYSLLLYVTSHEHIAVLCIGKSKLSL